MKYLVSTSYCEGMLVEDNDFVTDLKGLIDLATLYTEHTSCRFLSGENDVYFTISVKCLEEEK